MAGRFALQLTAALAMMGLVGCSMNMPLEGTNWKPISLNDGDGVTETDGASRARLQIDRAGKVSGCGGVNYFFGKASIADEKLNFGALGMTMMAGPGLPYENAFMKALKETASYSITGDKLSLFDADGKLLATFQAEPETEANGDTK